MCILNMDVCARVSMCVHQEAVGGKARDDTKRGWEKGLRGGRGVGMDEAVTLLCETLGGER